LSFILFFIIFPYYYLSGFLYKILACFFFYFSALTGKKLFCSAESFGAGATLQRCLVTWHLASPWMHRLMICVSQFLNYLGNISTGGGKWYLRRLVRDVVFIPKDWWRSLYSVSNRS